MVSRLRLNNPIKLFIVVESNNRILTSKKVNEIIILIDFLTTG
jgi:hypothetical protein